MRRVSFSCLQSNNQKCSAKQFRGDWLKVAPAAKRQFSAAADSSITYVCIQVKENSLGSVLTAKNEKTLPGWQSLFAYPLMAADRPPIRRRFRSRGSLFCLQSAL